MPYFRATFFCTFFVDITNNVNIEPNVIVSTAAQIGRSGNSSYVALK